jgi:putative adhesin
MRGDWRLLLAAATAVAGAKAFAQTPAEGRLLGARAVEPTIAIKAWNPLGSIRLIGWSKDSVVVRGTVGPNMRFLLSQDGAAMKLIVEGHGSDGSATRSDIVAYVPRLSTVSVKTVSADITADAVGGWFYTVSGNLRLSGHARSIEAESMNGSLDIDVASLWVKARTGSGHLLLRGKPETADLSTISGTLSIATSSVLRGQFASVTGDIHYAATPAPSAIIELSDHSGGVELMLPADASAAVALSSVTGSIENGFPRARAVAAAARSMKLSLGRGEAQLTVRTFKGPIRLLPQ